MAQLLVIKGESSGKIYTLDENCFLGSAPHCQICLPDLPEKLIYFHRGKKNYTIEILSEKYPVYLNDAPFQRMTLAHGDLIHIGKILFLFNEEEESSEIDVLPEKDPPKIQKRHPYYDSDERILETFSLSDRNSKRLQTLYKIHTCITKNLDLKPMMEEILDIIFEEFCPLHGFILRYNPENNRLSPLVQKGYPQNRLLYSTTILREVISKKESVLSYDAKEDERFRAGHSVIVQDLGCTLCAPMIFQNRILGVLQMDAKSSGAYTDQDLDQFSKIAAVAAIALDAAQTRQESQTFTKSLMLLSQGSQELFSGLETAKIRKKTLQLAQEIFEFPINVFIQLQEKEFRISEASGVSENFLQSFALSAHHPFLQSVRQSSELVIVNSSDFPGFQGIYSTPLKIVVLPLFAEEPPFQGLLLLAESELQFRLSPSQREIAKILANQTLVACQNATLHQNIVSKNEEIALWNQELEQRVEIRTKALQKAQKELAESEKMAALGRFASGIAHEFNNMLTSIFGFAQMAQKSEEYKDRLIEMVFRQTRRGREITKGLLELNRDVPFLRESIDLVPLLQQLLQSYEGLCQKFKIQVYCHFPETLLFQGDVSRLKTAFYHFLRNAIDSMEAQGGTLTLTGKKNKNRLFLTFQDTGVGIRAENIKKIFEPFYTTKGALGGGKQDGVGFGLSYCQRIIKEHQGEIEVQSEPGKGTCFTLTFLLPAENNSD